MRMARIEVPHYWTDDRGTGFGRLRGSPIHLSPSMRPRAGDTLSSPSSRRVSSVFWQASSWSKTRETLPKLDRWGRAYQSHRALGHGRSDGRVIYRNHTPATEFTAAQIAAHNPTDNSVIVDKDAILLSRTVACRSAGLCEDGR
jgi:hypothetical protein